MYDYFYCVKQMYISYIGPLNVLIGNIHVLVFFRNVRTMSVKEFCICVCVCDLHVKVISL